MRHHDLLRVSMDDPGDVRAVARALDDGRLAADDIVGIISQTEGSAHARALTTLQLALLLGDRLAAAPEEVVDRVPMMMIGLCGGLMSPHHTVLTRRHDPATTAPAQPRFAVGAASTRDLTPLELGTPEQVWLVAEAVRSAVADADLEPAAVTGVEIKCPAMTPARAAEVTRAGRALKGGSLAAASSAAKAASALGVAVALGEVDADAVTADVINRDRSLYTLRGSVSAGGEQTAARVLVMGNSRSSTSGLRSGCGVMEDQLDTAGLLGALGDAGVEDPSVPLATGQATRVRQVFVNCGADLTTATRGRRHTMTSDFLAGHAGIMAKAVANAVVAAVVGDPMILASAGAEHQGPPGANLINAVVEVADG